MKMYASILFDREIDKTRHYIVPGGYSMTFVHENATVFNCDTGEWVPKKSQTDFDFHDYEGYISSHNPKALVCEMSNLDTDCFPNSGFLEYFTGSVCSIEEFFVYTGEDGDPTIHPVKLISLEFVTDTGEHIKVEDEILDTVFRRKPDFKKEKKK